MSNRPGEEEGGNGWIDVQTRIPAKEEPVLVYAPGGATRISIDEWVTYREAPVGWSSATIETGEGWSNHEFEQVSHWMPLPAAPGAAAAAPNRDAERLDFVLMHLASCNGTNKLLDIIHDEEGFYVGKSKAILAIDAARAAQAQGGAA